MDVRLLMMISMVAACLVGVSGRGGWDWKKPKFTIIKVDGKIVYVNKLSFADKLKLDRWKSRSLNNNTAVALTCNQCSVGLFGTCLMPDSVECDAFEPNCYTGKAEFPSISGFLGFNTQGCLDSASCNSTTNGTILGATYKVTRTCCATDKCNPVVSGAGSVQPYLTAAASAALVACVWSSWQY